MATRQRGSKTRAGRCASCPPQRRSTLNRGGQAMEKKINKQADEFNQQATLGKGTQDIIALKFARRHADDFRFVSVWGQWFEWTGTHWQRERTRKVFNHVRLMLRQSEDGAAKPDIKM